MICQTSPDIGEIAGALAAAQVEVENIEKEGKNPHFKSKYATLSAVLDEVRPKFAKHGIAIIQMAVNGDGSNIGVLTRLVHKSGQWIESGLYVAPTKFDAQGAGSVISYLRRYALMAMAGVGQDDDDGEAAVRQPTSSQHDDRRAPILSDDPFSPAPEKPKTSPTARIVHPEETAEVRERRETYIREFWKRDWYGLDPEVIDGGLARWDHWMLQLANAAPNFDAFLKLKDDNREHHKRWYRTAAPAVSGSLGAQLTVIHDRLMPAAAP